jgi:hypothetical protein
MNLYFFSCQSLYRVRSPLIHTKPLAYIPCSCMPRKPLQIKNLDPGGASSGTRGMDQEGESQIVYLYYFTFRLSVNLWNGTPKENISAENIYYLRLLFILLHIYSA